MNIYEAGEKTLSSFENSQAEDIKEYRYLMFQKGQKLVRSDPDLDKNLLRVLTMTAGEFVMSQENMVFADANMEDLTASMAALVTIISQMTVGILLDENIVSVTKKPKKKGA